MKLVRLTCRCGHPRAVHDHYRAGTDCGLCGRDGCTGYRFAWRLGRHVEVPAPRSSDEDAPVLRSGRRR